jgi:hypothetical protein
MYWTSFIIPRVSKRVRAEGYRDVDGSSILWFRVNGKRPMNDPNALTHTYQSQPSAAHSRLGVKSFPAIFNREMKLIG